MKKKDFPIVLLQAVKNLKNFISEEVAKCDLITIAFEDLLKIRVIDVEADSTFYFLITDCKLNRENNPIFYFDCSPSNRTSTDEGSGVMTRTNIEQLFKQWKSIIIDYENTILTAEDEILKINQNRFLQQFQIVEEDAERATFDLEQQLFLDQYLNNVIQQLEVYKGNTNGDLKEIVELIEDAREVQSVITKESKKKVIHKLTKFWAKAQVVGLDIIKDIFVKYITDLSVKLLGG